MYTQFRLARNVDFARTFQNVTIAKECTYSHSDGARIETKPVIELKRVPHGFAGALRDTP